MAMSKKELKERREKMKARQERSKEGRRKARTTGRVLDLSKAAEDDIVWYRPKKRNLVDIIPFVVQAEWYPNLRGFDGKKTGVDLGDFEYKLEVPVHPRIGPEEVTVLCLKEAFGKKCFVCEQREVLDWKEDEDEMRALSPKWRVFYNLVDLKDEEEDGVKLWEVSYHLFEKDMVEELEEEEDERGEDVLLADLEIGHSIKFRGAEKKIPPDITFLEFKSFDFKERKEGYPDDILEDVHPLDLMLIIPDYKDSQKAFLGIEDEEGEEEEAPDTSGDDEPPTEEKEEKKEKKTPPPKEDLQERLGEMDGDDLLEFIEEKGLTIRGAKRKKPKELRKLILAAVAEEKEEEPEEGEQTCPSGFKFAVDCDEYPECDECDIWQECADARDARKS